MAILWTTPREWVFNEAITAEKMNDISNNMRYLFAPPYAEATVRGTGADVAITSITPVQINDALLGVSIEIPEGARLAVAFSILLSNATLGAFTTIDILIDDTTYLSSLTGSPLTAGIGRIRQTVAAYDIPFSMVVSIPDGVLTAGVHTFKPRAWVSASTATLRLATGFFAQHSVRVF